MSSLQQSLVEFVVELVQGDNPPKKFEFITETVAVLEKAEVRLFAYERFAMYMHGVWVQVFANRAKVW